MRDLKDDLPPTGHRLQLLSREALVDALLHGERGEQVLTHDGVLELRGLPEEVNQLLAVLDNDRRLGWREALADRPRPFDGHAGVCSGPPSENRYGTRDLVTISGRRRATLLTVARAGHGRMGMSHFSSERVLDRFELPSVTGNERQAMERVVASIDGLGLPARRIERLKTAVAEATMNAIEHGNRGRADLPVRIEVGALSGAVVVRITDHGDGRNIPEATTPDLEAKLAGLQKPRGWGLFLIQNMVDEMRVTGDERHHTIELVMRLEGGTDGGDD